MGEKQPLARFIKVTKWMVGHIVIPVSIAMVLGLAVGYFIPHSIASKLEFTVIIGLFWMLYPMMIDLHMGELKEVVKRPKKIGLSLLINFIISPLIIGTLVWLLMSNYPDLGAGMILVGVSPCSAMNTAASAFVGANIELTLGIIAISYLLTIIAAPGWATVLIHRSVPVPFLFMVRQIALVILIPMFLGWITRVALQKKMGEEKYLQIVPSFEGFSFLGVLFMIFFLFVINGKGIISHWEFLINIIVVSVLFFAIMMVIGIYLPRAMKLNYRDSASITITSVAKNESIAMALAFMLFGAKSAIGVAIGGVLVQVPFMVFYIQTISKKLKKKWGENDDTIAVQANPDSEKQE